MKLKESFPYQADHVELNYEELKPIQVTHLKNNKTLYDFGKVNYGTLKINTQKPSTFSFVLYEKYPYIPTEMTKRSFGYYQADNIRICDEFILQPPKRHLPSKSMLPLNIKGVIPFRYALVQTDLNTTLYNVTQYRIKYPFDDNITFFSSNKNLNKVFELTKHTVENTTFTGYFIDGERERKPYEADGYLGQLSQYALNSDYLIARRTQLYLLNNPTWPLEWQMHLISMATEDYKRTQDVNYIRTIYPELKKRLFLHAVDQSTGLLSADNLELNNTKLKPIIDWPPIEREGFATSYTFNYADYFELAVRKFRKFLYDMYGLKKLAWTNEIGIYLMYIKMHQIPTNNFVNQAHLYHALKNMQYLAKEIGNMKDAKTFNTYASLLKETLNTKFWNKKAKRYCDTQSCNNTSFQSNLFALAHDIVTKDRKNDILQFVYKNRNRASTYTSYYLLKILFDFGMTQEAIDYITKNDDRSWMGMINKYHATNTMESWNTDIKPNLDHTHIWSAHPLYFIIKYIIGVQKANKSEIIMNPHFTKLNFIKGEINIHQGTIKYFYEHKNHKVSYHLVKNFPSVIKFIPTNKYQIRSIKINGIRHDIHQNIMLQENNSTIEIEYKDEPKQ